MPLKLGNLGLYKYQIINDEGIEDSGDFEVIVNFFLADESVQVKSVNELLLEAVEAQIAGKATSAQQSMSVGDKSISYCSIDELFNLRQYFKSKVAEEKGENNIGNDEGKIKYIWSLR